MAYIFALLYIDLGQSLVAKTAPNDTKIAAVLSLIFGRVMMYCGLNKQYFHICFCITMLINALILCFNTINDLYPIVNEKEAIDIAVKSIAGSDNTNSNDNTNNSSSTSSSSSSSLSNMTSNFLVQGNLLKSGYNKVSEKPLYTLIFLYYIYII